MAAWRGCACTGAWRDRVTVAELDRLSEAEAREALTSCCGTASWVAGMLAARPFRSREALLAAADRVWAELPGADVAQAIAHHPRLGESAAPAALSERASRWSSGEQSGATVSDGDARTALAAGNAAYESRFGHTFILCASGLDGNQMLAALEQRLTNDPATERDITARELHRITRLRLEKLLAGA